MYIVAFIPGLPGMEFVFSRPLARRMMLHRIILAREGLTPVTPARLQLLRPGRDDLNFDLVSSSILDSSWVAYPDVPELLRDDVLQVQLASPAQNRFQISAFGEVPIEPEPHGARRTGGKG